MVSSHAEATVIINRVIDSSTSRTDSNITRNPSTSKTMYVRFSRSYIIKACYINSRVFAKPCPCTP